jgi:hypothetical protein
MLVLEAAKHKEDLDGALIQRGVPANLGFS